MTKVLALLTLAVLAFSAMTGPAFAPPIGGITVRKYGPVEQYVPQRWNQPKNATQFLEWGKRYFGDLLPSRPPGFLDNGIFGPNRF